jgi:hypothetical protein
MSLIGSDELFRYGVLPLVIGVVSATLSAFIQWSKDRSERTRTNRKDQLEKAVDICEKIIDAADTLTSHMRHDAWYIAWRKARSNTTPEGTPPEVSTPEGTTPGSNNNNINHTESDAAKWKTYIESLDSWRQNEITCGMCNLFPSFQSLFALA